MPTRSSAWSATAIDVWHEREIFALNASGGAPPDALFVKGQDWGFPPFNPEALRRKEYRYYIDCVRHHMAVAGMLRIDHVMGLHRAFWVSEGFSAADGLYVHEVYGLKQEPLLKPSATDGRGPVLYNLDGTPRR